MFRYKEYPNRLNLGCGFDIREGYLNVDLHKTHCPDLVADISNLHMLPAGYYSEILANDILEHLPRAKTLNTLKEWNRVLKKNGKLCLQTLDVLGLMQLLQESKTSEKTDELLRCLYGTQCYPGDYHTAGFTKDFLEYLLTAAGFKVKKITHRDTWLICVIAQKKLHQEADPIFSCADDKAFLEALYNKLLRREPDKDGFSYWLGILESGIARESVFEAFAKSDECNHR